MNTRLTIFLFVIWTLIFFVLLYQLRKRRAQIKYILPWLLLDVVMALVTAFREYCSIFAACSG